MRTLFTAVASAIIGLAGAASAATLDDVFVPMGAAQIDFGTNDVGLGAAFLGTGSSTPLDGDLTVFVNTPSTAPAGTFLLSELVFIPVPTVETRLAGTLMDIDDGAGFIDLLFGVDAGSRAGEFGDLVVIRLMASAFFDGYLDTLGAQTNVNANVLLTEVDMMAPIPVPAAALVFLSGAGVFAAVRKKAAA
ncbi:MAG: hypothetical protein AAF830_04200 [Pseudomonadota bacterium]